MRLSTEQLHALGFKVSDDGRRAVPIEDGDEPAASKTEASLRGRGRNKYGAEPTEYAGRLYDSKDEARRAAHLDLLLKAGEIADWEAQPRFELGVKENVYRADFLVTHQDGSKHVEDVKGKETKKFRRDKKLWKRYGPYPLWLVQRNQVTQVIESGAQKGES